MITSSMQAFSDKLQQLRKTRAMTQEQLARDLDVSRPSIAQWESARHLPGADKIDRLDAALRADKALRRLWLEARSVDRPEPERVQPPGGLLALFSDVGDAVLSRFRKSENDGMPGWPKNLQEQVDDQPASPLSTAYGIKLLLLLGQETQLLASKGIGLFELCQEIVRRSPDGWAARVQSKARPETTAVVLDAIARTGALARPEVTTILDNVIDWLKNDAASFKRTHVVASCLITLARLAPDLNDETSLQDVVKMLLNLQIAEGVWAEGSRSGASAEPSIAHTARALYALCQMPAKFRESNDVATAMNGTLAWLAAEPSLDEGSEAIVRGMEDSDKLESLEVLHFSAAWVARALLSAGLRPEDRPVAYALSRVWDRYDRETHLWKWPNGDFPIWMTFQAVSAIRLAALANYRSPGYE